MIGRLQRGRKVIDKRDVEVLELFGEPLRTRISGLLREESQQGWLARRRQQVHEVLIAARLLRCGYRTIALALIEEIPI